MSANRLNAAVALLGMLDSQDMHRPLPRKTLFKFQVMGSSPGELSVFFSCLFLNKIGSDLV